MSRHHGVRALLNRLRRDLGVGVTLVSAHPLTTVRNPIEDRGFEGIHDCLACPERGGCAHCRHPFATEMATGQREPARMAWISDLPGDLTAAHPGRADPKAVAPRSPCIGGRPGMSATAWPTYLRTRARFRG